MNPALDTLLLALSPEHGLTIPDRALFLGATPHQNLPLTTVGWQPLKPLADAWDQAGYKRIDDLGDETYPLVLVLPGKSRDETLSWFALAYDRLKPDGRLVVAMPNSAGAGRFEKELKKAASNVTSISKNKCRAFFTTKNDGWDMKLVDEWRELSKPKDLNGTYITQAGIFSSDHIDPGSQLLADHLPKNLRGHIADLGAGWGFLTDMALQKNPNIERIDLFEADMRAVQCSLSNLLAHTQTIYHHWHDVTLGLPDTYDAIIMNPPFHTGQATDIDLGKSFITTAANSLRRGGQLFIVANRQLPYESLLDSLNLRYRKPHEDPTYKLLFATKP